MKEKSETPNITINGNLTDGDLIVGNGNRVNRVSGSTNVAIENTGPVSQDAAAHKDDIAAVFAMIYQMINEIPPGPNKVVAEQAAKELETQARKGESADKGSVEKWLRFLAESAEDAWQVALDALSNPIKGISTAFRLVIARAKEERDQKK